MKKVLIACGLALALAGCNLGAAPEALEKAQALYKKVQQSCGVALQVTDLVDVVTDGKYAGVTATASYICEQISAGPATYGLFSDEKTEECVAVVNGVCVRKEDGK